MFLNCYTIFDVKSETYCQPIYAVNDDVLRRVLVDNLLLPDSTLYRHPEDFVVYAIGLFDDSRGLISGSDRRHVLDVVSLFTCPEPSEAREEAGTNA